MHTVANINSEIRICQRELFALGARETKSFMSVIAECIAEYFEMLDDQKRDFVENAANMETERNYKYTLTGIREQKTIAGLCMQLRSLENVKVDLSPHLLSIYSWTDSSGRRLQAGVGIIEELSPRIILFKLNALSCKILYNHCVTHQLTAAQSMSLFDFVYDEFVLIRKEQDDLPTFVTDGHNAQERAEKWIILVEERKISGDDGNIRDKYIDTLKKAYPFLRFAGLGAAITDIEHKFSPGATFGIYFQNGQLKFKAKQGYSIVFELVCTSHEELVYRICAAFEYEGKESMVCSLLREKYPELVDLQIVKTGR